MTLLLWLACSTPAAAPPPPPTAPPPPALPGASGPPAPGVSVPKIEPAAMVPVALVATEGTPMPAGAVVGGDAGCGAKVGFVLVPSAPVAAGAGPGDPAVDSLRALLALGVPPQPWYNAADASRLKVDRAADEGGTFVVEISGELRLAGTCSAPYLQAQVEQTIARSHPKYEVRLNGKASEWRCIGDMSGECK